MLNNNQSGNTNHSLVILHATLNVCGKSAADFARQRTTDRSFFFVVFWFFFVFLIFASVCVLRPPLQNFSDTVSLAAATAANTTTTAATTTTTMKSNNKNYNGIKLNENYRTFAAAAHWRTRKFEWVAACIKNQAACNPQANRPANKVEGESGEGN